MAHTCYSFVLLPLQVLSDLPSPSLGLVERMLAITPSSHMLGEKPRNQLEGSEVSEGSNTGLQ